MVLKSGCSFPCFKHSSLNCILLKNTIGPEHSYTAREYKLAQTLWQHLLKLNKYQPITLQYHSWTYTQQNECYDPNVCSQERSWQHYF